DRPLEDGDRERRARARAIRSRPHRERRTSGIALDSRRFGRKCDQEAGRALVDREALVIAQLRQYGGLVAFSHTIFAMPFAASALVLALAQPHAPIVLWRIAAMIFCMVAARTSAMAFNRWADRDVDAKNPRTNSRHVPAGLVSAREALALALLSGGAFIAC